MPISRPVLIARRRATISSRVSLNRVNTTTWFTRLPGMSASFQHTEQLLHFRRRGGQILEASSQLVELAEFPGEIIRGAVPQQLADRGLVVLLVAGKLVFALHLVGAFAAASVRGSLPRRDRAGVAMSL